MPFSRRSLYTQTAVLRGHYGPASCIAIHPDGTFVACGGNEGTSLWHLSTSHHALETPTGAGDRGMTTAAIWLTKRDTADDGLAYGTEDGWLVVWKHEQDRFTEVYAKLLEGGADPEITAVAYDIGSNQLAVVHRAGVVHRFLIDGSMRPRPMKSAILPLHSPQAVSFGHTGAGGTEIWSFSRDSGEISIIDEEANVIKTRSTGVVIGHAVTSIKDDILALDDVSQGVALYKLSTAARIKTLIVPGTSRRCRNIALHDQANSILCGSDHGLVYIFDRRTGDVKDLLPIGGKFVQSLSSIDLDSGTPIVVAGQSAENIGANPIQVWSKRAVTVRREDSRPISLFERIGWLVCTLFALMFIIQNIPKLVIEPFNLTPYDWTNLEEFEPESAFSGNGMGDHMGSVLSDDTVLFQL